MTKNKKILVGGVIALNIFAITHFAVELPKIREELRKRSSISLNPQLEDCLSHEIGEAVSNVTSFATVAMKEVASNSVDGIEQVTRDLRMLATEKILGNEIAAEQAYEFAENILSASEPDLSLARLYCMNAINHSPTKKKYFEKLVDISNRESLNAVEEWEQIRAALEIGLYQVSAEEVLGLRKMLAEVLTKIERLEEKDRLTRLAEIKDRAAEELEVLRSGEFSLDRVLARTGSERLQLLKERLRLIQELDRGVLSDVDVSWLECEDQSMRIMIEHCEYVRVIDECLTKAEACLNGNCANMGSVSVLVHMSSQILGQAWAMDVNSLPEKSVVSLHEYARRIEEIEIKFNRIKSQPAIDAIKAHLDKMVTIQLVSPYQSKIESFEAEMSAVSLLMTQVYDNAARAEIDASLREMVIKLKQCRQAQYKAYQEWAIERCDAGMKKYKSWMRVDIPDAELVINDYLIDIDSTLLTPDVGRLYQDVLGKQFAELKDHTASMEIKLAKAEKRQLKDF